MDFYLTEEQQMLRDGARRYLETECGGEKRRPTIEAEGLHAERWQMFADMGWLGLPLPEEYGGFGGTLVDVTILMQEIGRALTVEPYWPVAILAARTLVASGDPRAQEILPALAEGKAFPVLAHGEEEARGVVEHVTTQAISAGDGRWKLSGVKTAVVAGNKADRYIVSARTTGSSRDQEGITLFLVAKDAPGLKMRPLRLIDNRWGAHLELDGVEVAASDVLGQVGQGFSALEQAHDIALVALAAEAVGLMERSIEITRDYVKMRKQFGVTLSTFQAVQHRLADMMIELELARSVLYRAQAHLDGEPAVRRQALSALKYQVGKSGKFVCGQSIQLHGGIGVTEEYIIGHYFKRMTMIEYALGNSHFHLQQLAEMERSRA
ncbi:MAG: acyl-CoA dehydrogenase family protein [Rhodocyclaceae bacterium]|jgi:alkylation response protein AidB-like acyl-CoA dehydrogenase|nr:acyl-CoA dehydrogenase family protein [Rhodocyclaceae bacterium]